MAVTIIISDAVAARLASAFDVDVGDVKDTIKTRLKRKVLTHELQGFADSDRASIEQTHAAAVQAERARLETELGL